MSKQQRQNTDANFVVEDQNDPYRVSGYRGKNNDATRL